MPTDKRGKTETLVQGISASQGIAYGQSFLYIQSDVEVPAYQIEPDRRMEEIARFEQAILVTRQQIQKIMSEVDKNLGSEEARIFDAHLVPARVHLLGDQHGERGLHALPHLGTRHGDDHAVVARDLDPAAQSRLIRLDVEQRTFAQAIALAGKPEADAQKATTGDAADDRHAPGPLFHDAPPNSAAARCTARRMAL